MNESQYDDLIGKIYDASITPELWPVFLEQLSDVFDSRGTALYLADFANRSSISVNSELSFIKSVRIAPETGLSYDRYYSKVNVWLENSRNLAEGQWVTSDRLLPAQELIKTEWYNEWLKPQGFFHAMVGHLVKQDTLAVRLAIFRAKTQPFSADETALFARFVPHLRRSCLIHKQLAELKRAMAANSELLNRLPVGLILFDQDHQAQFINRQADSLIRAAEGFSLTPAGRCLAGTPRETRTLRQLIAKAAEQGKSSAISLQRRSSHRPLTASVVSLRKRCLPFFGTSPAVALFLHDPDQPLNMEDSLLMQCYGLTPAEAKLATALLRGQTPGEYAESRGIGNNTVKTQLKQVLAKTGNHRQTELVQMLTTGFGMLASLPETFRT